jgi:hypothetical protein
VHIQDLALEEDMAFSLISGVDVKNKYLINEFETPG